MESNEQKIDPRLARNYADLATDDQRVVYRQWADSYDKELIEEFGYIAPQEAVNAFVCRVPDRTAPVLDLGCGTGLAGKLLEQAGYTHIDGIDLSPEMLEKAAALNVYRQLWEGDLTAVIDVQPIYQAVICVGVFFSQIRSTVSDTQIAGLSSARWPRYRHSERERMAGYRLGRVIRTKSATTRLQT